jgi:hypothetical protein
VREQYRHDAGCYCHDCPDHPLALPCATFELDEPAGYGTVQPLIGDPEQSGVCRCQALEVFCLLPGLGHLRMTSA